MGETVSTNPQPDTLPADFFNQPTSAQSAQAPDTLPATFDFQAGEQTNDVGNKVIVPKDGESFADTMKRAAAYGKTVTPEQINKEAATMPAKVAQTVAAAPVIGAAGTAALAAPGEVVQGIRAIPGMTEALLQHAEAKAGEWAAQYPHLISIAKALGVPTTTAAVLGWLYHSSKGK